MTRHHPRLRFSISYTTRPKRRNEADGVDYLFVDEDEFRSLEKSGALLESARVFDNYYGTAILYVVGSWLILQVGDLLFDLAVLRLQTLLVFDQFIA